MNLKYVRLVVFASLDTLANRVSDRVKKLLGKEVAERIADEEETKTKKKTAALDAEKKVDTVKSVAIVDDGSTESGLAPTPGVNFGGVVEVPAADIPARSPPASRTDTGERRRSVAFSEDNLEDARTPQGSQPQL
jgi:hypothetical protein